MNYVKVSNLEVKGLDFYILFRLIKIFIFYYYYYRYYMNN